MKRPWNKFRVLAMANPDSLERANDVLDDFVETR